MRNLLIAIAVLVFRSVSIAAENPGDLKPAGEGLNAPEGFSVSLIASDPMVFNPAAMCVAPDGRIFVGEDFAHAHVKDRKTDSIKVLLGAEKGGKATEAIVLAEGLGSVQGMTYCDGRLYIAHTPHLSMLPVNANNKPGEMVHLFTGIGIPTAPKPAHCASGMAIHEGKLYFVFGDQGCDFTNREGKQIKLDSGAILRCDLDGRNCEVYASGFRNIYGVAFDGLGNAFVRDNTNDGGGYNVRSYHVIKGGYYAWPFRWRESDSATPPIDTLTMARDNGGGSPTGCVFLNAPSYPTPYRGSVLFCEWGRGMMMRATPTPKDATYDLPEVPFITETKGANKDYTFRPTVIAVAPDQSLIIADWASSSLYPTAGRGRIFRVTYTGPKPAGAENPALALTPETSSEDLLKKLTDVDAGVRARAAFLLGERKHAAAAATLQKLLSDADATVRLRAATALGDLQDKANTAALAGALATEKDRWARHAIIQALRKIDDLPSLVQAIGSAPETVQPELLYVLRDNYDASIATALLKISAESKNIALRAKAAEFLGLIARKEEKRWTWGDRPNPEASPRIVDWEATPKIMEQLYKLVRDPQPALRSAAVGALAKLKDANVVSLILDELKSGVATLDEQTVLILAGSVGNERALPQFVSYVTNPKNELATRLEIVRTLLLMKDDAALGALRQVAFDAQSPAALAAEAIDALGRKKDKPSGNQLLQILKNGQPELQRSAARAIGLLGDQAAIDALEAATSSNDRALRPIALVALWRVDPSPTSERFLKKVIELPPSEDALQSDVVAGLAGGFRDRAEGPLLLWLESGRLGRTSEADAIATLSKWIKPDANAKRPALLKQFADYRAKKYAQWKLPAASAKVAISADDDEDAKLQKLTQLALPPGGDPAKGAEVFRNKRGANCVACHTINKEGGKVGPELTEVGSKYPRVFLIESVLYPSKQLLDGYEVTLLTLKSGERVMGIIQQDDGTRVTLAKSDGSITAIPSAEIEKRAKNKNSLMPDGLANAMTTEDFINLIAYLETLKAGK